MFWIFEFLLDYVIGSLTCLLRLGVDVIPITVRQAGDYSRSKTAAFNGEQHGRDVSLPHAILSAAEFVHCVGYESGLVIAVLSLRRID